jgi:hypothetical protein
VTGVSQVHVRARAGAEPSDDAVATNCFHIPHPARDPPVHRRPDWTSEVGSGATPSEEKSTRGRPYPYGYGAN